MHRDPQQRYLSVPHDPLKDDMELEELYTLTDPRSKLRLPNEPEPEHVDWMIVAVFVSFIGFIIVCGYGCAVAVNTMIQGLLK